MSWCERYFADRRATNAPPGAIPRRVWRACPILAILFCLLLAGPAVPAAQSGGNAGLGAAEISFTDHEASRLLRRITDALEAHNARTMLAAFDIDRMAGGPAFRQQISSFFAQSTNIRVHFNLVQVGPDQGRSFMTVDAEMEADPVDDRMPPVHKQARLRFLVEASGGAWKFTEVQPRTFFSGGRP